MAKQKQLEIQSTTEYGKFKTLKGNRALNRSHLRKMMKAIEKNNLLPSKPIIVNGRFQVIDGQHRLEAAKKLGLAIYYVIVELASTDEMVLLNQNERQWELHDYLNHYIDMGKKDYQILARFMQDYEMSLSISARLLTDPKTLRMGHGLMDRFRVGEFVVNDLTVAQDIAIRLRELKPFVEGSIWKDREFIYALVIAHTKVKPEELLAKVKSRETKLAGRKNPRDYLRDLEDSYNKGKGKVNRVRFF